MNTNLQDTILKITDTAAETEDYSPGISHYK